MSKKNAVNTVNVRQIVKNSELALGAPKKDIAKYEKVVSVYGNIVPAIVAANGDMYQLIDGHARLEACTRTGINDIPVVVTETDDKAAQMRLSLLLSASREQGGALSEGALIEKLIKEHGQTLGELSKFIGRSKSWLSKRQTMARNLSPSLRNMVMSGAVCTRTAEEIAKLPFDEQATFASNIVRDALCKNDVYELVKLYRSQDATLEICRSIIEHPTDALLACPKIGKDRKTQKDKQSLESRIRGAVYQAINIFGVIGKIIIESDDAAIMAADSYLLKMRREMQVIDRLISAHVNYDISPGKHGGGVK